MVQGMRACNDPNAEDVENFKLTLLCIVYIL